jgi:hypothetical protein
MNNGLMSTDYDTLTISASNSADYIYTNTGTGTSSMAHLLQQVSLHNHISIRILLHKINYM